MYGDYGRQGDSAVFNNSTFGKAFKNNTPNLPHSDCIQGTTANARYYSVGDEAFPLRENLQRPYLRKILSEKRQIYNYSHPMNHDNLIFI